MSNLLKMLQIDCSKKKIWVVLSLFFFLFLQSACTELIGDEAYYWYYAQQLDWGYFDHPPWVALFIKLGISLLPGELGVRFFTIISFGATLLILWDINRRQSGGKDSIFFLCCVLCLPIFHIYSFITTPDVPLLFFSTLFLWIYLKDIATPKWYWVLLMALCAACILYSKYHGVLWIGAIYLYRLKYHIIRLRYYIVFILLSLFYLPHIYWQLEHNAPIFGFHLATRIGSVGWFHPTEYLLNVLLILNPVLVAYMIVMSIRKRTSWNDKKVYRYVFITLFVLLFFFVASFFMHAAPHWVLLANIPLVCLIYYQGMRNQQTKKDIIRICIVSLSLLIPIRILLMCSSLPIPFEAYQNRIWTSALQKKCGDLPVIFVNSYAKASWYSFYTKRAAYVFYTTKYHPSQYDINDSWKYELQGKLVMFAFPPQEDASRNIQLNDHHILHIEKKKFNVPCYLSLTIDSISKARTKDSEVAEYIFIHTSSQNGKNLASYQKKMLDTAHVTYYIQSTERDMNNHIAKDTVHMLPLRRTLDNTIQFRWKKKLVQLGKPIQLLCVYDESLIFPISNIMPPEKL